MRKGATIRATRPYRRNARGAILESLGRLFIARSLLFLMSRDGIVQTLSAHVVKNSHPAYACTCVNNLYVLSTYFLVTWLSLVASQIIGSRGGKSGTSCSMALLQGKPNTRRRQGGSLCSSLLSRLCELWPGY